MSGRSGKEVAAVLLLGQEPWGRGDEEGLLEAEEIIMGLVGRMGAAESSGSPCGLSVTDSSRNVGRHCANNAGVLCEPGESGGRSGSAVARTAVAFGGEAGLARTGPAEARLARLWPGMSPGLSASFV